MVDSGVRHICSYAQNTLTLVGDKKMNEITANVDLLMCYAKSMQVALAKAKNGSTVEDTYFLEKLQKTAHTLGYNLVKQNE